MGLHLPWHQQDLGGPCHPLNQWVPEEEMIHSQETPKGKSLVVQWLGLCALIAESLGLIPSQETKIHKPP